MANISGHRISAIITSSNNKGGNLNTVAKSPGTNILGAKIFKKLRIKK